MKILIATVALAAATLSAGSVLAQMAPQTPPKPRVDQPAQYIVRQGATVITQGQALAETPTQTPPQPGSFRTITGQIEINFLSATPQGGRPQGGLPGGSAVQPGTPGDSAPTQSIGVDNSTAENLKGNAKAKR